MGLLGGGGEVVLAGGNRSSLMRFVGWGVMYLFGACGRCLKLIQSTNRGVLAKNTEAFFFFFGGGGGSTRDFAVNREKLLGVIGVSRMHGWNFCGHGGFDLIWTNNGSGDLSMVVDI